MYKIIGGDQKEYGPASAEEMRHWIRDGRLNAHSRALAEGSTDWRPLSSFPEFADALAAQAAPAAFGGLPPLSDAVAWRAQVLSRPPSLHVGRCLAEGGALLSSNFGVLFGATCLLWLITTVMQFLPVIGVIYFVLRGVFYGGLYLVFLSCLRGQRPGVNEVFRGFGPAFTQLLLAGLITSLLSGIGFLLCFVPWIYLTVAWVFAVPLAADKRLEFWSAMELSRRVVNRVWPQVFLLLLLAFFPVILVTVYAEVRITQAMFAAMHHLVGSGPIDLARLVQAMPALATEIAKVSLPLTLLTKLVLLLNLPFGVAALISAYESLFGPRPPAST